MKRNLSNRRPMFALPCVLALAAAWTGLFVLDARAQDAKLLKKLNAKSIEINYKVTDDGLKQLARSETLERVYIDLFYSRPALTGEGLRALAGLKNLKDLTLTGSIPRVPGVVELQGKGELAGLKGLRKLQLHTLNTEDGAFVEVGGLTELHEIDLSQIDINDARLTELGKLPKLQSISIHVEPSYVKGLTSAGFKGLANAKALRVVALRNVPVNDDAMKHLAALKDLETLILMSSSQEDNLTVSDEGMKHLAGLTRLSSLAVSYRNSRVTDAGVKHLAQLKELTSLNLRHAEITDEGMNSLAGLTKLESLDLAATAIANAGAKHLSGMAHLKALDLRGNGVLTAPGLKHLHGLKSLQQLRIRGTKMSGTPERDAQLAELRKALPKCKIVTTADYSDP